MKVYLVRHGQTDTNIKRKYNFVGEDINEKGIQQAEELKEKIKDMDFDVVYCSPLLRARHTANIINVKKKEIIIDNRLEERRHGNLEGKSVECTNRETYWDYYSNVRYGTEESIQSLFERVKRFLDDVKDKNYEKILVVAHKGVSRAFDAYFQGIPKDGKLLNLGLGNAEIKEYELEKVVTRPTVMEVNINHFKENVEQIKKRLDPRTTLMPIMKANAYGTYLNTRLEVVNEFEIIGLATVDEGINLRKTGYQKEIFILNQPARSEIDKILENRLIIGLSSLEFVEEVKKREQEMRIHLEIETGMGRTGISPEQIPDFLEKIEKSNIKIEGIYTHLSSPDIDDLYTKEQLKIFQEAVEKITSKIKNISYIHAIASNGIINYPEAQYNLVRAGMILYGYESGDGMREKILCKPVTKLKSQITFLKTVKEGTSISYGRCFETKRESKIATVPIGYADGFRRSLSNKGYVVIRNQKVPVIGKVCMDSFMVDVTDLKEVEVGDDVWIWDNHQITLEEIAHQCDTINYEIISTISNRVPRQFM